MPALFPRIGNHRRLRPGTRKHHVPVHAILPNIFGVLSDVHAVTNNREMPDISLENTKMPWFSNAERTFQNHTPVVRWAAPTATERG